MTLRPLWQTMVRALALACVLLGCGDDDDAATSQGAKTSTAQPSEPGPPVPPPVIEEPPPTERELPVADDFAAMVNDQIDETNYRRELDRLEMEISKTK
jgi:hypothetical protein